MKTCVYLYLIVALFSPVAVLLAQTESAVAKDPSQSEEKAKGPEYNLRDPFWPVGWTPAPKQNPLAPDTTAQNPAPPTFVPQWAKVLKGIEVKSIAKTFIEGEYIATVTGFGVVEKGDTLSIKHEGHLYKVVIRDITEKGIVPEKSGVSPLK